MLYVAAGLVFAAGIPLFLLSGRTERGFAWTIDPPLTAAFLGAGYWASFVFELLAARERTWARVRLAVPAVLVFTTLTLIATLIHLDRFHFHGPTAVAQGSTWGWLAVYVVVPPLLVALIVQQLRTPGFDTPRTDPLSGAVRALLAGQSAILLGVGAALYVAPARTAEIWPWSLTPLTGRAVAAWLLGIGVATAHTLRENDWQRVRVGMVSFTALGVLETIALLRYSGDVDWRGPAAYVYLAVLARVLGLGAYGWRAAGRARGFVGQ